MVKRGIGKSIDNECDICHKACFFFIIKDDKKYCPDCLKELEKENANVK